jgi:ferrous iron transport protein A
MVALTQLRPGQKALIRKIGGGRGLIDKISCLNLREDKIVTKVTHQPFNGPVVIKIDNCQVAIGRGIAEKIEIDLLLDQ